LHVGAQKEDVMAQDYEDVRDVGSLSDDEMRLLVREQLDRQRAFDPADIVVSVAGGQVTLTGRVGTSVEQRVAEHFITDVLGIHSLDSQLVVDPMRRAESPEAVDEHIVDEEEHAGLLLGDEARPFSPESEHLADDPDADIYGTTDVSTSIEGAIPWIPPESPTPEGMDDRAQR
jgi:hypothetical protein